MADDIAALIDHLGLEKPDLVGYSIGGGVAMQTAAKYPDKVGKLVAASVNLTPDALDPALRAQQGQVNAAAAEFMKDTPCTSSTSASRRDPRTFRGCWTRSAK